MISACDGADWEKPKFVSASRVAGLSDRSGEKFAHGKMFTFLLYIPRTTQLSFPEEFSRNIMQTHMNVAFWLAIGFFLFFWKSQFIWKKIIKQLRAVFLGKFSSCAFFFNNFHSVREN